MFLVYRYVCSTRPLSAHLFVSTKATKKSCVHVEARCSCRRSQCALGFDPTLQRESGFGRYSAWDTMSLVPAGVVPDRWRADVDTIPVNRSFMHLHLGFDATGLEDLELHHIVVNSWEGGVDTEQVRAESLLVPFHTFC
jgi:hypothetical protein